MSHLIAFFITALAWSSLALSDWSEDLGKDFMPWNGDDLAGPFKSAPNLRPPSWNISVCDQNLVTPGFLFVGPYTHLRPKPQPFTFQPAQIGPAIYDNHGELVWTGAAWLSNRNVFDFKVVNMGNNTVLSFILTPNEFRQYSPAGKGVYLDRSYQPIGEISAFNGTEDFDMHEFNTINNGSSALVTFSIPAEMNGVKVLDNGFVEMDVATGDIIFEWSPLPHINLTATYDDWPQDDNPNHKPSNLPHYGPQSGLDPATYWDWIHVNSVEKTAEGDYIVSARATSAIYKISHLDGSIVWQLGGKNSSFILHGFDFSHQHDARIQYENDNMTILSLLDNAADDKEHRTAKWSSALIVALDTITMEARVLRRWDRPDHSISYARGNVQILPTSNAFVAWSDDGYVSEFTDDGKLVFEARFSSHRFTTYRSYKFNFTGDPTTDPDSISYAYGSSTKTSITAHYVSWNGATEVSSWRFYGSASNSSFTLLGTIARSGFETTFISDKFVPYVYVVGLNKEGEVLGSSVVHRTVIPSGFALDGEHGSTHTWLLRAFAAFSAIVAVSIALTWLIWRRTRNEKCKHSYKPVPNDLVESGT